jgi:small subunit ribosomal protein S11
MAKAEVARVKRKERKNITSGVAHVNASFNNTMITIADMQGNTDLVVLVGRHGFQGLAQVDPVCGTGCRGRCG